MRKSFISKNFITTLLILALVVQMPITVLAAEETSSLEFDFSGGDSIAPSEGSTEVLYDGVSEQKFTVTIPKNIKLSSDGKADYFITVKGDVAAGSYVTVEPSGWDSSTKKTTFTMEPEKSGSQVNAIVTQNDNNWNFGEITANNGEGTDKGGNIDASGIAKGKYHGTLTFNINFYDEYATDSSESGGGEITPEPPVVEEAPDVSTWVSDPWNVLGTEEELDCWDYNIQGKNIVLNKYKNTSEYGGKVIVRKAYEFNGKYYMTRLPDHCNNFITNSDVTSVQFDPGINTTNVIDMSEMFRFCGAETISLCDVFTTNVTSMKQMFRDCNNLKYISWGVDIDTSNVTNMEEMFLFCTSLTDLDLSFFDTSNVTNMNSMFAECGQLKKIFAVSSKFKIPDSNNYGMFYDSLVQEITYTDL